MLDAKAVTSRPVPELEPWVDVKTVARHLGFHRDTVIKMFRRGELPGVPKKNGARTYLRFRLSEVDAAFAKGMENG